MQKLRSIILVTLDCVRSEALSCYPEKFTWYQTFPVRAKTPNIAQIAQDGVTFTQAICQAPFTPASHASILTGLNPYNHGIRAMIGYKLSDCARTLAEELKEHGYRTAAFVGSHALKSEYGLNRGFDVYDESFENRAKNWILGYRRPAWESTDRALAWLNQHKQDNFFLFLHYFDAHDAVGANLNHDGSEKAFLRRGEIAQVSKAFLRPIYERSRKPLLPIRRLWESIANRKVYGRRFHLSKVRELDAQIARILKFLSEEGLYGETLIVIMADHGDSFGERGEFNHREYLYDTTLRIPLIIKGLRNLSGKILPQLVRSIDVYPTVLEMLGVQQRSGEDHPVDGVSLVRLMKGYPQGDLDAYSETRHEVSACDLRNWRSHLVSLRTGEWKLIINRLNGLKELYDLKRDPGEYENVWVEHQDIARQLEEELQGMLDDADMQQESQMSHEELGIIEERLRGFGYL